MCEQVVDRLLTKMPDYTFPSYIDGYLQASGKARVAYAVYSANNLIHS